MKNLYILVFSSSVIHPIINKVFGGTNMKQIENMGINKLVYPEGYYWSSKNGVTNKHNTASGQYESFDLYEMKLAQ